MTQLKNGYIEFNVGIHQTWLAKGYKYISVQNVSSSMYDYGDESAFELVPIMDWKGGDLHDIKSDYMNMLATEGIPLVVFVVNQHNL